jgi:hypothetical protein
MYANVVTAKLLISNSESGTKARETQVAPRYIVVLRPIMLQLVDTLHAYGVSPALNKDMLDTYTKNVSWIHDITSTEWKSLSESTRKYATEAYAGLWNATNTDLKQLHTSNLTPRTMQEAKNYSTIALVAQAAIVSLKKRPIKLTGSDGKLYYEGGNMISPQRDSQTLDQVYMIKDTVIDTVDINRKLINNWHETSVLPPKDEDEVILSLLHLMALLAKPAYTDYDDRTFNQTRQRIKEWKSYHSSGLYVIQIDRKEEKEEDQEKKERPVKKNPIDEKAAKKDLRDLIEVHKLMQEEPSQSIHTHRISTVILSLAKSLGMGDVTTEELSTKLTSEQGLGSTFSYDDVVLVTTKIASTSKAAFKQINVTKDLLEDILSYDETEIEIKDSWSCEATKILAFQIKCTRCGDVYDGVVHNADTQRKEKWVTEAIETLRKIVLSDDWVCTIQNTQRAQSFEWKEDLYFALIPKTELDDLGIGGYEPRQSGHDNEQNENDSGSDEEDVMQDEL